MQSLQNKINNYKEVITFPALKIFIQSLDIDSLEYQNFIEEPEMEGDYGRNILTLEPFECVLINWPAGVESAVHHHQGLFGYVLVLEGELDNHSYLEKDNKLIEARIDKYVVGGLMPEPDGVIHKLCNSSESKRAITLHFYYPAIHSFEGMRIFNLETGDEGILSDNAKTACWSDVEEHFTEIKKKTFEYVSNRDLSHNKSHIISSVFPKPAVDRINEMNGEYFCEQAEQYDFSDFNHPDRKSYTGTIDTLIAEDIKSENRTKKHLDIATGTGRRALEIREKSNINYELVGVDISEEMCKIAESRGIRTYHQDWANDDSHTGEMFDSVTFLYAFGHIASLKHRLKTLKKINSYLNKGGYLYVDLFSAINKNEWGPLASKVFEENKLGDFNYQKGDVFYKKLGLNKLAFLHYFEIGEIEDLLNECGFEIVWVKNVGYAKNAGQIVTSGNEGNYFVKAKKVR